MVSQEITMSFHIKSFSNVVNKFVRALPSTMTDKFGTK